MLNNAVEPKKDLQFDLALELLHIGRGTLLHLVGLVRSLANLKGKREEVRKSVKVDARGTVARTASTT